jgi:hypothetical protein
MRIFSSLLIGLVAFNALIFVALYLRQPRPEMRARFFNWAVRGQKVRRPQAGHRTPVRA